MSNEEDASNGASTSADAPVSVPHAGVVTSALAFWKAARERKVAQWGAGYLVAAFGLLQGAQLVSDTLDWSPLVARTVLVMLGTGFPIALIIAWSHGERGRQRVTMTETVLIAACLVGGLSLAAFVVQPSTTQKTANANTPRLAVLRFESLGDTEPYFAEGVADELISEASRIQGLEVTARASSFALTGARATPQNAARELGATLMLSGSVRRAGEMLRVHAQLVEAPDGRILWDQSIERPGADLYTLQRDIAVEVARAANLRVATQPARRVDPEALRLYLRGRESWYRTDFEEAQDLFRQAAQRDRNFALAWGWHSLSEAADDPKDSPIDIAAALAAADRAISLDRDSSLGYEARGLALASLGNWTQAVAAADAGVARGGISYGVHYPIGRIREVVASYRRAVELDPLNHNMQWGLASACYDSGDLPCAIAAARRHLELAQSAGDPMLLFLALRRAGDWAGARRVLNDYPEQWRRCETEAPYCARRFMAPLVGLAPPAPLAEIIDAAERGQAGMIDAVWLLSVSDRADEAVPIANRLLAQWGPAQRRYLGVWYDAQFTAMRRLPAYWAMAEREGLLKYWRESGRWPDFCTREPVCKQYRQ